MQIQEEATHYIKQHLVNYRKWIIKEKHNGIVLENSADTPRLRKRLTIYNKEQELKLVGNKDFLNLLSNQNALLNYFKSKIRFEFNINTKTQIRAFLKTSTNSLNDVLTSTTNPLATIINEAIKETETTPYIKNVQNYLRYLLLKECSFNLAEVEAKIRALSSTNTVISRRIRPYKQLLNNLSDPTFSLSKLQKLVSLV